MSKAQVILLAGGKGSRLKPFTTVLPKPLLPLGDIPIAEIIIRQLKFYRLKNIVISTGHLAGLIETYFGDGKRFGVNIRYVKEKKPLGTAGALKLVNNLADHVLVINGDTLTNLNFSRVIKEHKKNKSFATIVANERIVETYFGVVDMDAKGLLKNYFEKPQTRSFVSTGIYILNKKCKQYIKAYERIGMPSLLLRMKDAEKKVHCFKHKGMWYDLGRSSDFEYAQSIFAKNKKKLHLK